MTYSTFFEDRTLAQWPDVAALIARRKDPEDAPKAGFHEGAPMVAVHVVASGACRASSAIGKKDVNPFQGPEVQGAHQVGAWNLRLKRPAVTLYSKNLPLLAIW